MKFALAFMVLLALGLAGFALATHESTTEEHIVPGTTIVVPDRTITDEDPLPHPVTTTETVYVTVTAPVPPSPPPPTPPPPPPPVGTVVERTTGTLVCNQPLANYGPLPVTFRTNIPNLPQDNQNGDVRILAGCTGDGDPATTDLRLEINGNGGNLGAGDDGLVLVGAHDLQIEGYVNCGRPQGGAHQDGVQMNYAHRIEFRGFTSGNVLGPPASWVPTCHGAGGVFYVAANGAPSTLTHVVCVGCRMAGSTTGPVGTGLHISESEDSGAVNSTFAARRPCFVGSPAVAVRPVNVNNTCVVRGS